MNERTKRQFYRDYPILIPYQIDFNTTTVGRHIRQTKRHVTWRFGFTHIPSVLDNKTGVACRGLELEIHLVWSVASGKQVLYLNNVLLHQTFPASSSSHAMMVVPSQRFEHSMYVPEEIVPGGHVIHITAWALGFGSHGSPDNQFSMTLDGQNYRDFYPMYKLGSPEMRNKYSVALEKAREKISRLGREHDQDQEKGEERNPTRERRRRRVATTSASTTMSSTTSSRPFMMSFKEDRYWEKPTVSLPSKAGTTASAWDNASAPDLLPPDIRPEDVARNDREEETLLAQARLESFRDLKRQQEQRARMASDAASKHLYAADQRQEEQFLAQARIRSFRDIRGSSGTGGGHGGGDDVSMAMSIPSFARPPPVHRSSYPAARYHPAHPSSSHHLKPVKEGAVDLLDVDDQHHQESQEGLLRRSESSVTLDTAIQSPDDDLMSLTTSGMSDVYSHLDPRQNWRTQQNVSFRLQKPPVYADTLAGDLIQPSASFSNDAPHAGHESSVAPNYYTGSGKPVGSSSSGMGGSSNSNVWQQAATYAGRNMDYYKRHATTTMPSSIPTMGQGAGFVAAPPPTWESIQEAYAVPSVPPSSSNSSSNPYPSSWQQPIHRQHP